MDVRHQSLVLGETGLSSRIRGRKTEDLPIGTSHIRKKDAVGGVLRVNGGCQVKSVRTTPAIRVRVESHVSTDSSASVNASRRSSGDFLYA